MRHSAILTERPHKSWPWRAFGVSTGQHVWWHLGEKADSPQVLASRTVSGEAASYPRTRSGSKCGLGQRSYRDKASAK